MRPPILITGCSRSGATIIAKALHASGVFGGRMIDQSSHGHIRLEHQKIQRDVLMTALCRVGADPLAQFPLPPRRLVVSESMRDNFRASVEDCMKGEGLGSNEAWFYKDPRNALMWKLWETCFPGCIWIVVRRSRPSVIDSCVKTGWMRAFSFPLVQKKVGVANAEEGWNYWLNQYEMRFEDMRWNCKNYYEVWPEFFEQENYADLLVAYESCGLLLTPEVRALIAKELRGRRGSNNN